MHHSRAQLSWQTQMCKIQPAISLSQQPSLTPPFLRGNSVKTNTHARLKTKGRRQRHVAAQNSGRAPGLSSDLAIMSCVPSPFTRHAAFSTVNPGSSGPHGSGASPKSPGSRGEPGFLHSAAESSQHKSLSKYYPSSHVLLSLWRAFSLEHCLLSQ